MVQALRWQATGASINVYIDRGQRRIAKDTSIDLKDLKKEETKVEKGVSVSKGDGNNNEGYSSTEDK